MEQIQLCDNGPVVSPVIYSFWRSAEDPESISLKGIENKINTCIELGINTFDHADIYGGYEVEAFFGKAVKQKSFKRENIVLSTKCGTNIVSKARPAFRVRHFDNSAAHIRKSVETSLKNLQTDYIDILLLQGFDHLIDPDETASEITNLINKGLVQYIGVADFSVAQHKLLQSRLSLPIITNHIELNLLRTQAITDGTLDFIKEQYSRPLAWAPMAGGRLLDENDVSALNIRNTLKKIATKYEINEEQLAIAWLMKLGALPIVGTNSIERIKNATSAVNIELDRQDWYEIYFSAIHNKAD
jgi:predicted oxidoreductase